MPKIRISCVHCRKGVFLKVSCQRFKDGRIRLRLDCERCGCFSHYMEVPRIVEVAIEDFVEDAVCEAVKHAGPKGLQKYVPRMIVKAQKHKLR